MNPTRKRKKESVPPVLRKVVKQLSKVKASKIRESYHASAFAEKGADDQQKQKSGATQKGRVYLVTIIEEGLGNSKDKNYYSGEALKNGIQVFNGSKAFCDHPDAISEKTLPERSMRALVGWYSDCFTDSNPKTGKVRLRGKLHFFPAAKWLTDMIDTILTDPSAKNLFGISINAIGKTRPAQMGGEQVNYVEEFQRVDSADVVTEPAARGKFDAMLESRRGQKVTSISMKRRTREAGVLSPEKAKEVADSLVSAYNSDSPDELKQAAFEASKVLHAASSISGKGPGQVNEEQYSNINPSGGSDSMNNKKVKASSGSGGLRFRRKKALRAAAGTGSDNENLGEPEPSDIENELEEADVEDAEGRGELGDQQEYGGGKKYRTVKASRESLEDEGMEGLEDEDEGMEGLEDEDEDGMGMATPSGAGPAAAVPATPGSSRSVPASAAEADDSEDDSSEGDGMDGDDSSEDLSESVEDEHDMMRPGNVAESRSHGRNRRMRRSHEADGEGSSQGSTVKKASYAGGLGHSGHTALPKGADPDRGYEDSDEDWGKEDSSTSGVGKSYKMKTSRFSRNRAQRRIAKPIVREANRRIEELEEFVSRLRESNRAKDRKINRYQGIMRFQESVKSANKLVKLAVDREILSVGAARQLRESLYGLNKKEQVHEIKMAARLLESATEGAIARLSESVDGAGARGGVVSWRPAGAENSELLEGFASDGIPVKEEE